MTAYCQVYVLTYLLFFAEINHEFQLSLSVHVSLGLSDSILYDCAVIVVL